MNVRKILPVFFLAILLTGIVLFLACEKSATSPEQGKPVVDFSFKFSDTPANSQQWIHHGQMPNPVPKNSAGEFNSTFSGNFGKPNAISEAKLLVLDMTQWNTMEEFLTAWDSTGQDLLFDTTLWDSTRDIWENETSVFNSYTGDYYQYAGEYNLTIQDSVAKGTVSVNAGLNYFFLCLRENGRTSYWGADFGMIEKDHPNKVMLEVYPTVYVYIYSPLDSAVYQQGMPVPLQGYAYDEFTYQTIPPENMIWSSDKDGVLGTGESLEVTTLSANEHKITLTATTTAGAKGTATVHITVM